MKDGPCAPEKKMTRAEEIINRSSNILELTRELMRVSDRLAVIATGDSPKVEENPKEAAEPQSVFEILENLNRDIHSALVQTQQNLAHLKDQLTVDALEKVNR